MAAQETQQLKIMNKNEIASAAQTPLQSPKTEEKLSEDMKALVRALMVHSMWTKVGLLDPK